MSFTGHVTAPTNPLAVNIEIGAKSPRSNLAALRAQCTDSPTYANPVRMLETRLRPDLSRIFVSGVSGFRGLYSQHTLRATSESVCSNCNTERVNFHMNTQKTSLTRNSTPLYYI